MDSKNFKQAFMELAEEMERECGDWQNRPDTEADQKFRERIMAEVTRKEQEYDLLER